MSRKWRPMLCFEAAEELTDRARFHSLGMIKDPLSYKMEGAALVLKAMGVLPCPKSIIEEFKL